MMTWDIDKDFNAFFSLSDEVTPSKFKNNLRIILGSKPERFKNNEAQEKLGILRVYKLEVKISVYFISTFVVIAHMQLSQILLFFRHDHSVNF